MNWRSIDAADFGRRAALVIIACNIGLGFASGAPAPAHRAPDAGSPDAFGPGEFVVRNVRVFDGERVIPRGEVWVSGGTIRAVARDVHAPANVRAIDGEGGTLLPGLIDAHTHAFGDALRQALVFGCTTELDMFTDHSMAAEIKKKQAEGLDADMADLRSAGTLVTAPHGHGTEYGMSIPTIERPEDAQAFVDARCAEGSDYIKIIYDDGKTYGLEMPTINKETLRAVVDAAHRRDRLAIVHIGTQKGAVDAIQAGADGLAHLFSDTPPEPGFASLVAGCRAFVVPTLSVLSSMGGGMAGKALSDDPRLKPYLSSLATTGLMSSFPRPSGNLAYAQETIRRLKERHVPILAGTDAPNPGTTHGASLHGELALLVEAGLTATEALAAATSVPADRFHLEDRGRIAVGKRADLLLVKGDPTTDITATRDIVEVWKRGIQVDRKAYRASIEKERLAAEQQSAAPAPAGSESGIISDFEDGAATARFGSGWQVSSDKMRGGESTADMSVVDGGAEGSKKALRIEGMVAEGAAAWAGAMFFPGATPMAPANLSGKKALSFRARGNGGTYVVMLFCKSNGYMPKVQTFVVTPEWKNVTMAFEAFETDGHDIMGIFFGSSVAGRCDLSIDDVRLDSSCTLKP
jgi:imidazolonepropionase-like amidohydrolase